MAENCSRREFFRDVLGSACAFGVAACVLSASPWSLLRADPPKDDKKIDPTWKESMFYRKLDDMWVRCEICPRRCTVANSGRGYCGTKENRGGIYYTCVYGKVCAFNIDPIEKKPLYHFKPGTATLSLATAGCNFECRFCQNWQISQFRPEQVRSEYLPPEKIVRIAQQYKIPTISYTYTEPVVFYTFMYDTATLAKDNGILSVVISNGYICETPLLRLLEHISAYKVDLKAFTESFYKEYCRGELKPVLDTIKVIRREKVWTELVVLIIPTLNDSESEIKELAKWVVGEVGCDVPVHFTRFHPTYKLTNLPATPVTTLTKARDIARAQGLQYVYVGNAPGHEGENTYCPKCGEKVIGRVGFRITKLAIVAGNCSKCGHAIPGVW